MFRQAQQESHLLCIYHIEEIELIFALMLQQFLNHIEQSGLVRTGQRVLLAVSGGVDSMVMLPLPSEPAAVAFTVPWAPPRPSIPRM